MKRAPQGKRRDRRTGQSPYARHGKRETTYSPAYYAWLAKITGKTRRPVN